MFFKDRKDAGEKLSRALEKYINEDLYILALPRGGVPVAYEIARRFNAPLDVIVVRKLGYSWNNELGFGAIAPGITVLNEEILDSYPLKAREINYIKTKEETELARRVKEFRNDKKLYDLKNKTALIVDDGIATGVTILAAIRYAKGLNPRKVIVATPVCAPDTLMTIEAEADDVICLETPFNFNAVAEWYEYFPQTSDAEVKEILKKN